MRTLRTYLGRVIRDIARKIGGNATLLGERALLRKLALAQQPLDQKQHQRGPKVYSLLAPGSAHLASCGAEMLPLGITGLAVTQTATLG